MGHEEESDRKERRTSTQALHVIPSIRNSHVSEGPPVSGSPSTLGSSTEPPAEDLLSKFVSTVDRVDIIASSEMGGMDGARLVIRVEEGTRRPAYGGMREDAEVAEGEREAIVPSV